MKKKTIAAVLFSDGVSCCGVLLAVVVGLVAVLAALYAYCRSSQSDEFCRLSTHYTQQYVAQIESTVRHCYTTALEMYHSYRK